MDSPQLRSAVIPAKVRRCHPVARLLLAEENQNCDFSYPFPRYRKGGEWQLAFAGMTNFSQALFDSEMER